MPLFKCENCGKTTNTALTACYWGSEKKLCYECCLEARKEVEKALCNKELTTKAVKLAIKDQNKKMKKPPKCLDCSMPAALGVKGIGGLCKKHADELLVAALLCREQSKIVAKKKKRK